MNTDLVQHNATEHLARKRAAAKLGWYIHAAAYIAVNLLLAGVAASTGKHWAVFPALGWGLGLAIHGAVVFLLSGGAGLFDRLVQREREQLAQQGRGAAPLQRDPW